MQTFTPVTPLDSPEEFTEFKTAFMQEIGKLVAESHREDMDDWRMGDVDLLSFDAKSAMQRNIHGALWSFAIFMKQQKFTENPIPEKSFE